MGYNPTPQTTLELATASPSRYMEIGIDILNAVLEWVLMAGASGFEKDELRAEAWIRLHELSRMADHRPRTRLILRREIKKCIINFIKRERSHTKWSVGLFQMEEADDENDEKAVTDSPGYTHHHCAPYSFKERLTDSENQMFSGLKTWNFSHLDSEGRSRRMDGIELIREEQEGIIRSLGIKPFMTSEAAARDKRACYSAA